MQLRGPTAGDKPVTPLNPAFATATPAVTPPVTSP
jgi:hypothetical protein